MTLIRPALPVLVAAMLAMPLAGCTHSVLDPAATLPASTSASPTSTPNGPVSANTAALIALRDAPGHVVRHTLRLGNGDLVLAIPSATQLPLISQSQALAVASRQLNTVSHPMTCKFGALTVQHVGRSTGGLMYDNKPAWLCFATGITPDRAEEISAGLRTMPPNPPLLNVMVFVDAATGNASGVYMDH